MSCCSKEKMERNDCVNSSKSHLARSEREMFRVCPSKLSKRELEDLYFTLLENNLELKKTINKQQDNIRMLSTQVQRMTNNQEKLVNKEMKECCTGTRSFVNDQKIFITELKETNQRLAERIQHLNMRLSSAKQFQKTSTPPAANARLNIPLRVANLTPKKHHCLSKAQEAPQPASPDQPLKLSTFCQWEDKSPKKATQTQISSIKKSPKSDQPCDANKCKSLIDELKLEVVTLQEELTIVHYEYSTRIGRLEAEVADVRKENLRVSSERTASQHELQTTLKQNSDILARFRRSEAKCAELAAELSIEKRKVAELDTLLKAANLTDRVNKTMEEHLITLTEKLQGTVLAPKETDENPPKRKSGRAPPSKVTDGMAADTNWRPEISKQKDVEDRAGKSSPTKYMPSKSTSSAGTAISVELDTPTKTSSKEISCNPCDCRYQIMSNTPATAEAAAPAEVTDRKNQEYPHPPPKDLSPRPEDRQKLGYPSYPPPKDLSTRLEDRKNPEYPYPPPKDLSTRPEERQKREYPPPKDLSTRPEERQKREYPSPKDLSTRPEDRINLGYPTPPPKDSSTQPKDRINLGYPPYPPPKELSPRPEDRNNQEYPYPPPKDLSTRPEERQKRENPSPKDLSTRPEDRLNIGYPSTPPKDLSTQPKDRINLGYPPYPPPKELSPRPEDRSYQEYPYPSPKDLSTRSEDCAKVCCPYSPSADLSTRPAECKCYADINARPEGSKYCNDPACSAKKKTSRLKLGSCLDLPCLATAVCACAPVATETAECDCFPPPQDERTKCKICCYPDPVPSNDKVNSPRGARTRFSPTKEIDNFKSKLQSNPADDSHYESDEMALLKQNKQLLVKILELQNKVDSMKKGVSESPEGKLSRRSSVDSASLIEQLEENDKGLSTKGARTRFSPTRDKDNTKSTNTADDSGYQESDETGLLKMNKELLLKISELQNQVDCIKIGVCQMSEAQSGKLRECQETPPKSTDPTVTTAPVKSPPLLTELTKASESSETKLVRYAAVDSTTTRIGSPLSLVWQSEFAREIENTLPLLSKESEEGANRPQQQKLRVEVLGNPKDSETSQTVDQAISSDETRAKTVQCCNGTLQIPEDHSSDEYLVNYDSSIEYQTPKLTITEKKKLEVPDSSEPDIVSIKSGKAPRLDSPRLAFNPEKLKYLENERIIAKSGLENRQAKLEEDSESIISVPSNHELGFNMLRLASKDQKAEIDSGQAKTSLAAGPSLQRVRNDNLEILPGKLKLPMTETLAGNYPTAMEQTDEKKTEDCEYCAACSFDKECELKHENGLNKKDIFSHLKKDINRKQKTRNPTKDEMFASQTDTGTQVQLQKTSITTGQHVNLADVPLLDQRENCTTTSFAQSEDSIKDSKKTIPKKDKSVQKQKKEDDFIDGPILFAKHTCGTSVGPVNQPNVPLLGNRENGKLINDATDKEKIYNQKIPMFEIIKPTEEARVVERTADLAQSPEHKLPEKASQAITTTTNKAEPPRGSIRESARQRNVSMYRRASGTICFRSEPVSQDQPACDCPGQVDGYCTDHSKNKGVQIHGDEAKKLGSPRDRYRQRTAERGTYTLGSNRAETPDTDVEMSYLPDLPLENEKKNPGKLRPLSPGEDRTTTHTTTTQSDYSQTTTARNSLSEGEMPPTTKRRSSIIIDKPYLNPALAHKLETPPSHQMEAALNTITDELQRCKNLLHAKRYDELPPRASQTPAPAKPRPIALKPAIATQGIGNAHPPMSIFTLHIGTIVLSDEAVLYSRNKNLLLKWKFYNQPVTMTHMRAGRVVVFDFSTQYDITITEDFLNYLKHEQMPIIICELDQEDLPFATAALPLRDALLLVNTRADKSVALLAGPQIREARAPSGVADAARSPLELRDEVGVIDLWCMLRADASMMPGINLAIAQPRVVPKTHQNPGDIQQVQHDSNELDIAMGRSKPAASYEPTGKNQTYADVEYHHNISNPWQEESKSRSKQATEAESTQTVSTATEQHSYDLNKYPAIRGRAAVAPRLPSAAPPPFAPLHSASGPSAAYHAAPGGRQESKMIINEVNTTIKSPRDIILAAGRNRRSESRPRTRKSDETTSQALHSSYGSLLTTQGSDKRNFIEKLRKASRTGDGPRRDTYRDRANYMDTYKKKESIGKLATFFSILGANKAEQSKKVTIQNEHNASNMTIEQPQRDFTQEPKQRNNHQQSNQKVDVTVLWLALNEECEAMLDPDVQRVYVAYTFLGRAGAELETPVSLPKPKNYVEKCYFNFKKTFELEEADIPKIGHMARCRAGSSIIPNDKDCIIFSVVSEPAEDPLGIESCEDIGYAFLYLGDLLAYSAGSPGYTEVSPVRAAGGAAVCGVLAVRLDGLDVVRRCDLLTPSEKLRPS